MQSRKMHYAGKQGLKELQQLYRCRAFGPMVKMGRVDQIVAGGMSAWLQMAYSISEICAAD
jgi:hypothetical protein